MTGPRTSTIVRQYLSLQGGHPSYEDGRLVSRLLEPPTPELKARFFQRGFDGRAPKLYGMRLSVAVGVKSRYQYNSVFLVT